MTDLVEPTVEQPDWPSFRTATYEIEVVPMTPTIGAELRHVSLARAARNAEYLAELRELLLRYKVLFVRDQNITRAEHVALAERFGPLEDSLVAGSDPDHPGLVRICTDLDSKAQHYGNAFQCDATWRDVPALGSVLRCVETPAVGGDTIWVNMAEAYRRLPQRVKQQIAGLHARHSIEASFGAAMPEQQRRALHRRFPDAEHPVVRMHPETGEEFLYVNAFTTHFVNFHTPQNVRFGFDYSPGASELLNYLIRQAAVPEFQVRWRWTRNSFAIWDNRCTQHYDVQDHRGARKMERAGIVGADF